MPSEAHRAFLDRGELLQWNQQLVRVLHAAHVARQLSQLLCHAQQYLFQAKHRDTYTHTGARERELVPRVRVTGNRKCRPLSLVPGAVATGAQDSLQPARTAGPLSNFNFLAQEDLSSLPSENRWRQLCNRPQQST